MRPSSLFCRAWHHVPKCIVLFAIALGLSPAVKADPIIYSLSGNFAGTLGGQTFSGPVTFQLIADTDDVQDMGGYAINTGGVSTVTVNGQTASFLSDSFGVEGEYFSLAFLDTATFDFAANVLNYDASADALSQIGISFTGSYTSLLTGSARTSLGVLQLTGADGDVTFQTVSPATAATPEPSSLLLLGTGVLTCAGVLWSRSKANASA